MQHRKTNSHGKLRCIPGRFLICACSSNNCGSSIARDIVRREDDATADYCTLNKALLSYRSSYDALLRWVFPSILRRLQDCELLCELSRRFIPIGVSRAMLRITRTGNGILRALARALADCVSPDNLGNLQPPLYITLQITVANATMRRNEWNTRIVIQ